MMRDTVLESRLLAALDVGPATLAQVAERTGVGVADALPALRGIGRAGRIRAARAVVSARKVGPVYWHMPDAADALPKPRRKPRTPQAAIANVDHPGGHDGGPRSALERLTMLAQRSTWREPMGGRSTAPGSPSHDVLRALSCVEDQLGAETALAVACMWLGSWNRVVRLADHELHNPSSSLAACLPCAPRRYRLKLVLYDTFHDMVGGGRRTLAVGAKVVGMRRSEYADLYGRLWNHLECRAHDAASDALRGLRDGVFERAA